MALHPLPNLFAGGAGVLVEQPLGGDDESGRAEAALDGPVGDEGPLEGVELRRRPDSLDGEDLRALLDVPPGNDAGTGHLAVQDDVTDTALAHAAAELGTGQLELVSDDLDQFLLRVRHDPVGDPVDPDRLHVILLHASLPPRSWFPAAPGSKPSPTASEQPRPGETHGAPSAARTPREALRPPFRAREARPFPIGPFGPGTLARGCRSPGSEADRGTPRLFVFSMREGKGKGQALRPIPLPLGRFRPESATGPLGAADPGSGPQGTGGPRSRGTARPDQAIRYLLEGRPTGTESYSTETQPFSLRNSR